MARKTIIVVDEADDLFIGVDEDDASDRRGSKVFMKRLIERAAAPTIWIANDVDRLGPAVIRRINLALRFPKPTLSVRKAMVARIAKSVGFRLHESAALELARTPRAAGAHRERDPLRDPYSGSATTRGQFSSVALEPSVGVRSGEHPRQFPLIRR